MSYFRICPLCGAALDPGEACSDCKEKAAPELEPPEAAQWNISILKISNYGGNVK